MKEQLALGKKVQERIELLHSMIDDALHEQIAILKEQTVQLKAIRKELKPKPETKPLKIPEKVKTAIKRKVTA